MLYLLYWTSLPMEEKAKRKMNDELFREYVKENGYHFTCALANHVCSKMVSRDDSVKPWTSNEVAETLDKHGIERPRHITNGDATYIMNMAKMDFYPDVLKDEDSILKYANAVMHDADGYDGMVFGRWLSDDLFKDEIDDWDVFI